MSFITCLWVILGGAIGTFGRFAISYLAVPISRDFPWGTVIINVTGCALIGLFGTLTLAHGRYPVSDNVRLFVMVGICGGYTTFSSFSLQTLDLLRSGAVVRAVLNVAVSVVVCMLSVWAGHALASRLNGGAVPIAQAAIEEEA